MSNNNGVDDNKKEQLEKMLVEFKAYEKMQADGVALMKKARTQLETVPAAKRVLNNADSVILQVSKVLDPENKSKIWIDKFLEKNPNGSKSIAQKLESASKILEKVGPKMEIAGITGGAIGGVIVSQLTAAQAAVVASALASVGLTTITAGVLLVASGPALLFLAGALLYGASKLYQASLKHEMGLATGNKIDSAPGSQNSEKRNSNDNTNDSAVKRPSP